jgi:CBS domain-containing protein
MKFILQPSSLRMICPRCGTDNLPGSDECSRCLFDLGPLDQPVGQDRVDNSLLTDLVAVLPLRPPVTVPPETPVVEVIRRMIDERVGALLVVDPAGALLGIFSERDLLLKVVGRAADQAAVANFMTARPETIAPHDTLALALHKMDVGSYRHLPVVAAGKPLGVISVRNLLRHVTSLCDNP